MSIDLRSCFDSFLMKEERGEEFYKRRMNNPFFFFSIDGNIEFTISKIEHSTSEETQSSII